MVVDYGGAFCPSLFTKTLFLVLIINTNIGSITHYLIPFAAGGFIYVASADIIPELHKSTKVSHSVGQLLCIIGGVAIMYALLIFG